MIAATLAEACEHFGVRDWPTQAPLAVRVLRRCVQQGDCWVWTGSLNRPGGYGETRTAGHRGRKVYVHRAAYELMVGPIPEGLHLDHLCRTRTCIRPDHLEPVTQGENLRRGDVASRGRCEHGVDFPLARVAGCAPCQRARHLDYYYSRKQAAS